VASSDATDREASGATDRTASDGVDSGAADGSGSGAAEPGRAAAHLLLVCCAVAAVVLVPATTRLGAVGIDPPWPAPAVTVPPYVYLYAALGATAYAFTRLLRAYDDPGTPLSVGTVTTIVVAVLAATPLAAGVYLLSSFVVDVEGAAEGGLSARLLAGVAFLTGLFVNRAYDRLGRVADRLLPGGSADATDPATVRVRGPVGTPETADPGADDAGVDDGGSASGDDPEGDPGAAVDGDGGRSAGG